MVGKGVNKVGKMVGDGNDIEGTPVLKAGKALGEALGEMLEEILGC